MFRVSLSFFVFFFKQKTAYEMRISDWSSDVCSSDLRDFFPLLGDLLKPGTHFRDIIQAAAEAGVIVEAVTDPDAWITSRIEYHRRKSCQFQQLLSDGRWIQTSERATNDGGRVTIVTEMPHFRRPHGRPSCRERGSNSA